MIVDGGHNDDNSRALTGGDTNSSNSEEFVKRIRVSGLGRCPKALAYDVLAGDDRVSKASSNPRLFDGHYHEWDIKRRLVDSGVRFLAGLKRAAVVKVPLWGDVHVTGGSRKIDGIVTVGGGLEYPEGYYILNVKSMSSGYFWKFVKAGYRIAFPDYFAQLQGELNAESGEFGVMDAGDTTVITLYKQLHHHEAYFYHGEPAFSMPNSSLVVAKNKESGELRWEVIEKDEAYFEGLKRRWELAYSAVKSGGLPDRLHDDKENYECARCPWSGDCWSTGLVEVVEPEVLSEQIVDASEAFSVGKFFSTIGERLMEDSKSMLERSIEGKVKVGPLTLTTYKTSHTYYNHKELERMLTPEQLEMVSTRVERLVTRKDVNTSREELIQMVNKMVKGGGLLALTGGE